MIAEFKHRRVAVYLNETETPVEGFFLGIEEGFVMLAAQLDIGAEMTLIDRDAVWCITVPPTEKQGPAS